MQIKDVTCKIISNIQVAQEIFLIKLKVNNFPNGLPGQFIMLQLNDMALPILRRPFAIFNQGKNFIEIGYRVVGKGTQLLSTKTKGEYMRILGPLGNGFRINKRSMSLIIAGGIGIASVFYLVKKLGKKATLLFGAKSKKGIVFLESLKRTGAKIYVATEDGSFGKKGLVTSMMTEELLRENRLIYACGPSAMLRSVAEIAARYKIDCQVSLEARMACGFGVCLGCVVPVINSGSEEKEYLRVCSDGPVFDARIINWDLFE